MREDVGNATYKNFRIWLDDTSPTEEMWDKILDDDEKYNYSSPHDYNTPPVQSEVNICTSTVSDNVESSEEDS